MPTTHLFVFFICFILLIGSLKPSPRPLISSSSAAGGDANPSAHDLLVRFGLPRGYSPDGEFSVELATPCYIQFSDLAYYHRAIRGRISPGLISGVSGIQAKKFLIWVTISSVAADEEHSTVQFSNGVITESLPTADFADVRHCEKWVSSSHSLASDDAA
ncbi:unnamed protein product [Spirodela intermedia]|uniref:Uncharacterized protein n=1 Tax=Spirodela intermedia TaxID=51605 RepID=A0A7I8IYS0_SPIIN|nr:unnamed protein product [Spirodela intermedia]CAA6662862.1 unnamed protein product [Spirodela intermedia]